MKYPELSQHGKDLYQSLIDNFKLDIEKSASEVIGKLYTGCAEHIESDSWINFRNQFVDAFMRMDTDFCGKYDMTKIAYKIASIYPDVVSNLINQENVKEIQRLKELVEYFSDRGR